MLFRSTGRNRGGIELLLGYDNHRARARGFPQQRKTRFHGVTHWGARADCYQIAIGPSHGESMSQHRLCVEPGHQKGMRGGEQRIETRRGFCRPAGAANPGYRRLPRRRVAAAARVHALHRGRLELRPMKADRPGNNNCEEKWVHLRILWGAMVPSRRASSKCENATARVAIARPATASTR